MKTLSGNPVEVLSLCFKWFCFPSRRINELHRNFGWRTQTLELTTTEVGKYKKSEQESLRTVILLKRQICMITYLGCSTFL